MNASRVEPVPWQDEYSGRQFLYTSETSRTSTILPPVTGHVSRADEHSRRRQLGKLPEWSRYSESELSSRLLDSREMSLPELNRHTQMMTSRRLPPARAAAAAAATTRCAEEKWTKHWSSELPAHNRRSWRQSTDNVSYTQSGLSVWPEDGNHLSKIDCQQLSTGTVLWRSCSSKGLSTDTSLSLMPAAARKPSLSMDSLRDCPVIISSSLCPC